MPNFKSFSPAAPLAVLKKKKRHHREINVRPAAPFGPCAFLCTCTSAGLHRAEYRPAGFQLGSVVFSRPRVPGGEGGDAKGRESSQLAEPALPSLRHDPRRTRTSLGLGGHPAGRANSARPPRQRARAPRPRPPAAGKPGRGAGAGGSPGRAGASSLARLAGSLARSLARPPLLWERWPRDRRTAPLGRAVPPHRDSALCAGGSPGGGLVPGRGCAAAVPAGRSLSWQPFQTTQVPAARRSSGVTRLRLPVGGLAESLGGKRRRGVPRGRHLPRPEIVAPGGLQWVLISYPGLHRPHTSVSWGSRRTDLVTGFLFCVFSKEVTETQ